MKKYILGLIGIILQLQAVAGEIKYPVSSISEELLADAKAVIRLDARRYVIHSEEKRTLKHKWACTILSSKADGLAEYVNIYGSLSKVISLKGYVYDKNGKQVKKLKQGDIIDQSYIQGFSLFEDSRIKIAKLSHSSYPYTVEFECEVEYFEGLFYPSWYPKSYKKVAVEKTIMEVEIPDYLPLRWHEVNVSPVSIKEQDNRKVYTWVESSIPSKDYEPFTNEEAVEKKVLLAPKEFKFGGVHGDMSTWKSFGDFQNDLMEGTLDLSEEGKTKVKELVAGISTEKEKVAKVYNYLQETTRYVSIQEGVGGIKPFPASLVEEKGYGDCKALSNYTKAMLESIDIEAYYVVVGADDASPIIKDFPRRYFNHAILVVPLEKDTVWLECTNQTKPFGYMGDFTGDRDVFVITPEGGEVWRTPAYKKDVNYTQRNAKVKIDKEGNAQISVTTKYSTLQEGNRTFVVEKSKEEQKKWLYEQIELSDFAITDFSMVRHKSELPYTMETIEIEDSKFANVSGKRIFIKPNMFSQWEYVPPKVEERKNPVYLSNYYDFIDTDTIIYEVPENYHIEYKPEMVEIKTEFGSYTTDIQVDGNQIKYIRRIEMNPGTYPKESYDALRSFYKDIMKNDKAKIVVVNNT